jgi:hypothetical protein
MARVNAGEKYLQLLHVADVILHPFPFGGSRTSAEGTWQSCTHILFYSNASDNLTSLMVVGWMVCSLVSG